MTNHAINSKKYIILLESFKVRPTISAIMASALKPFADDLETELTCSICQEIFTQPKTLPCLHNYCSKCIVEWYEKSGNKVTKLFDCPMCKARIDVPDGDATKLRSSFYLDSLLQLLHAMRAKSNHEQPELSECMSCERRSHVVAFCPQCNGMICNDCVNSHKTVKQLRLEHQAKMLADFKQENVNSFIQNQMLCNVKFHEKNKLEYYCHEEACKKCICQKCAFLYHRHHDMLGIEEAAEQAKQAIRQDMDRMNKLKERYEEEMMQSRLNIARIENNIDLAKQQVEDVVEAVVKMARDHRATMMESLNRILLDQQKANQEEQSEIETVIKQLSEFSLRCQKLLDKSVACEILVSKEDLQKRCQRYLKIPSILSSKQIQRNVKVRYVTKPEVMQSLQNIGNISVTDPSHCSIEPLKQVRSGFLNDFVIITRNSEGEECHTDKGYIDVRIKDGDGNEVVEKTICDEQNGTRYRVNYRAEKAVPYEILVNIAGQPIKNSPQKVNTLDIKAEFEYVKTFWGVEEREEGALEKLLENEDIKDSEKYFFVFKSISLSDINREIAIHDFQNHCVQISNLEGDYLRKIGPLCPRTGEGQRTSPTAVVFNEDKIIVGLLKNEGSSIYQYDLNGTYLKTIYGPEEKFLSFGMCVTDEQNLAVCCITPDGYDVKSCIKIFSKQDHLTRDICSIEQDEDPLYITYNNGKYFLSYGNVNYIRVYDKHGAFLYTFGEEGEMDGQFDDVTGLAAYGPDMILVCDAGNNRVQLITTDGQFVRSFKCGTGEMDCPVDVAVAADGKVFVVTVDGRVQIWR